MNVLARLCGTGLAIAILAGSPFPGFAQPTVPPLAQTKLAAEAGDAAAQYKLAEAFVLRTDTRQAEHWYRKSAAQGYAPAQGTLGKMLLNRSRMPVSYSAEERVAAGAEALK